MPALNLRLDDDEHAILIALARDNKRSLNAQVQWLIRQEAQRRPDTGGPISLVCGSCGASRLPDGSARTGLPLGWESFIVRGERRYACPACIERATRPDAQEDT